ncbi:hypothetical protein DM02DRAFT_141418 [Periconia macrospinosa]|uniref:Transmembrane protein n=1 Tax=Periconia macrospinosa TaxID=97972 RepID=A0A2V1DCG2_9PLEO|nr:hypothetical protein DM02DRAFT_141418 [Periconia macrospinosa]
MNGCCWLVGVDQSDVVGRFANTEYENTIFYMFQLKKVLVDCLMVFFFFFFWFVCWGGWMGGLDEYECVLSFLSCMYVRMHVCILHRSIEPCVCVCSFDESIIDIRVRACVCIPLFPFLNIVSVEIIS